MTASVRPSPRLLLKRARMVGWLLLPLAGVALMLAVISFPRSSDEDLALTGRPVIVFGGDRNFPPYEFINDVGQPDGLNVDLIRAVGRALGVGVVVRLTAWTDVRAALADGSVDVATMYRSAQRAREVDFAVPHELVYHEMFIRVGSAPLLSIDDLEGLRVLAEADTYATDALADLGFSVTVIGAPSEPDALKRLAAGEADVAVVTQTVGRPFRERSALRDRIAPTGPPILLSEYAFVTKKGHQAQIERLNRGIVAVKASGEYERIYGRWLRPDRWGRLGTSVAIALAMAVVFGILVVAWNRSLRRVVNGQTARLQREYDEKERALVALAESEASLRRAQKMEAIGRLAGGVAHDFNNLLTVILSYSQFLREEAIADGRDTTEVDEILAASERASRLTRQLLAFSRSTPIDAVQVDVCAAVVENRAMLQRLVGEHISVEVTLPSAAVTLKAEPTQIEQILLNLGANARDAMPDGGHLLIAVGLQTVPPGHPQGVPAGEYATIRVTDSGVGMDEATQAHIFEPFYTTKETGKGTGLGLATVQAHVARLGGHIDVTSAPGAGTTFLLLLPASPPDTSAPALKHAPGTRRGPAETILLVEDDEALRRAGRIILEQAGHRVIEAADGEQALQLEQDGAAFTMVVTDVVMPRLSGPRLVAALRGRGRDLRVLYVSGYVTEGERLDLSVPGTAYLAKPYTPMTLVDAVQALAGGSGAGAFVAAGFPRPGSGQVSLP